MKKGQYLERLAQRILEAEGYCVYRGGCRRLENILNFFLKSLIKKT